VGCEMYRLWVRKNFTKWSHEEVLLRYVKETDSDDGRRKSLVQVRVRWRVSVAGSVSEGYIFLVSYNIRYCLAKHTFLNLIKLRYHVCVCVSAAKSS
jgi:hypothetical protein